MVKNLFNKKEVGVDEDLINLAKDIDSKKIFLENLISNLEKFHKNYKKLLSIIFIQSNLMK